MNRSVPAVGTKADSIVAAVVDLSVRHHWRRQDDVTAYLSRSWRQMLGTSGSLPGGRGARSIVLAFPYQDPMPLRDGGGAPYVTDYETLRRDHLDRHGIAVAVLTYGPLRLTAALPDVRLSVEVARAANDWTRAEWLERDNRLRGSILIAAQDPSAAAAEIRRCARDDRMVQVLLGVNSSGRPLGDPGFRPIFAAAAEVGLPVAIHAGGEAVPQAIGNVVAGGVPSTYAEYHALRAQGLMSALTSLILSGVLERFRTLKIVLAGGGFAWLPALMWRFDENYKALRREVPWVKRAPSEYLADQVRLTTYPLEPGGAVGLPGILGAIDSFERLLCYASGYPESDLDTPEAVIAALPGHWASSVMGQNALLLTGSPK